MLHEACLSSMLSFLVSFSFALNTHRAQNPSRTHRHGVKENEGVLLTHKISLPCQSRTHLIHHRTSLCVYGGSIISTRGCFRSCGVVVGSCNHTSCLARIGPSISFPEASLVSFPRHRARQVGDSNPGHQAYVRSTQVSRDISINFPRIYIARKFHKLHWYFPTQTFNRSFKDSSIKNTFPKCSPKQDFGMFFAVNMAYGGLAAAGILMIVFPRNYPRTCFASDVVLEKKTFVGCSVPNLSLASASEESSLTAVSSSVPPTPS